MDNTSLDYTDTWVIIPCFNEGAVIGDVIRNVRHVFPNVVAVNDGSTDDSAAQIKAAGAHLVNHPVNLGQGAALQTGVEYARSQPGSRYFVTFDADGQHQVKDVVEMLDRLRTGDLDIVVGTRFGRPRPQNTTPRAYRRPQRSAYLQPQGRRRTQHPHEWHEPCLRICHPNGRTWLAGSGTVCGHSVHRILNEQRTITY